MNVIEKFPIELWLSLFFIIILALFSYYYKKRQNLTLAQVIDGDQSLLDVDKELDTVIQSVHSSTDWENIHIKYYSTLEQNIFIKGNKHKFHHLLIDLVKDGLEASQTGSIEIAVHEMLSSILIVIEHNGRALTKEQIKGMSKSILTTNKMGSMKGKIEVISNPSQGTSFSLIIPKASGLKANTI
ncbi:ATP-binding protein [Bacillus sp. T3]|uniref:ATP-binding protein n=1 Tax=Bacillus sp. T3 TaxID=467262 RepID=UPI002980BDD0|nr:ATP-binding protein [Bacillus sp. T3]